ncbi:MAG: prephenate dehydrogenase/arogenate dehydrogenase family protein, partial [Acidobacteriota bacterium]|nr:prephenate dehydrogenase/arogenate dehydrogenase family protein [Acidobacteriota bacterium]
MNREWRVVTVAGVGLIGGSFALALRQAGFAGKIIG